jgi:hypothetical protein
MGSLRLKVVTLIGCLSLLSANRRFFTADFDYRLSQIETSKNLLMLSQLKIKWMKADVSSFIQDFDALRRHGSKGTYCMNFLGGSSVIVCVEETMRNAGRSSIYNIEDCQEHKTNAMVSERV